MFNWEGENQEYFNFQVESLDQPSLFKDLGGNMIGAKYFKDRLEHVNPQESLFQGSTHTLQDFFRYMLALKQALPVGDETFASIVGIMISFLPSANELAK